MQTPLITALFLGIKKSKIVFFSLYTNKGFFLIPIGAVALVVNLKSAIHLLIALMIFDFITGIGASWSNKKKAEKADPTLEKKQLISSEKLKLSGVKMLLYGSTIWLAYKIEELFLIKTFTLDFSEKELTLTIGVIAFWCMVELFSIIFENFKAMGFDVLKIVSKIFNTYKTAKKEIKNM
ncbi:phage holin family protein [Algibacter miyuki]|uniref:Phage holin family protein n=1 Tax=Algibacter miyuki TaxID=1306933 RepID=A0ABV5H3U5_9FLAO|nr:phage holin family protein [Algibacter miyuki]MDN3665609.1 phage holin family protein [Algibacter miyuki]